MHSQQQHQCCLSCTQATHPPIVCGVAGPNDSQIGQQPLTSCPSRRPALAPTTLACRTPALLASSSCRCWRRQAAGVRRGLAQQLTAPSLEHACKAREGRRLTAAIQHHPQPCKGAVTAGCIKGCGGVARCCRQVLSAQAPQLGRTCGNNSTQTAKPEQDWQGLPYSLKGTQPAHCHRQHEHTHTQPNEPALVSELPDCLPKPDKVQRLCQHTPLWRLPPHLLISSLSRFGSPSARRVQGPAASPQHRCRPATCA